mgnify:CR=1 FL=1
MVFLYGHKLSIHQLVHRSQNVLNALLYRQIKTIYNNLLKCSLLNFFLTKLFFRWRDIVWQHRQLFPAFSISYHVGALFLDNGNAFCFGSIAFQKSKCEFISFAANKLNAVKLTIMLKKRIQDGSIYKLYSFK